MVVRYCVVPNCTNNSLKNSKKIFVRVPAGSNVRENWFNAINPMKRPAVTTTHVFVCEDHFDLPYDSENWMKFRMMGYKLMMKKDVVPHKNLQKNIAETGHSQISSLLKKRKDTHINIQAIKSCTKLELEEDGQSSIFQCESCQLNFTTVEQLDYHKSGCRKKNKRDGLMFNVDHFNKKLNEEIFKIDNYADYETLEIEQDPLKIEDTLEKFEVKKEINEELIIKDEKFE